MGLEVELAINGEYSYTEAMSSFVWKVVCDVTGRKQSQPITFKACSDVKHKH